MFDAFIFDIDGTLWNASQATADGWNRGLAKLGVRERVSAEQIRTVSGKPFETCVELLLPGVRHPELQRTLSACERHSLEREGGRFYDDALDALARLSRDVDVFLVSNCQDWYLDLFLGFSGLNPLLRGTDCHGRSGLTKSEMLGRMRRVHSLASPVYVGDTSGDEEAAAAAGIGYVHAGWGFGRPDRHPLIVSSFADLLALAAE